ncbi:hypothetical protein AZE42_05834 [Rhizopogon vesiculosus]|uniref:Uncharacterized protein n=1 Tax=Rhizopogon vesiculosus TaxID=180088 RepID=A0A1J8QTM6_9AGAM|nr:hypothetical protein AZE42_05834 [Rhizopogon vesiculosus]
MKEHPRIPEIVRGHIREPVAPPAQPPMPVVRPPHVRKVLENASSSPVGYLVSVLMQFSAQVQGPASRGSKVVKKKLKLTKSDYIVLEGITCAAFVTSYLSVHDLSQVFSPGVHSGPPFKLYWTGSVGDKGGATMIDNDHGCDDRINEET